MGFVPKKHLKELVRLRAGTGRDNPAGLFLDRNERIAPYDAALRNLLAERLASASLNLYPEVAPFYKKLALWLNVGPSQLFITEGVSGAVKALIEAIAVKGNNIVFPVPTFALYPVYCRMFDVEYRTVGYTEDYELDVGGMLKMIDDKTSLVFLPNPNVPIEGTLGVEEIASIVKHCAKHNAFLVIDEVYYLFGGPTAIGMIKEFDNLFVMRSFSKAFGLAGIRVGYIVGTPEHVDYVSKTRTGYEVNTASMEIASFFVDNYHFVEKYIRDVKEGIDYLKHELAALDLQCVGGNASNFVYVNMHDRAMVRKITDSMKAKNVYIRGDWPGRYSEGFSVTAGPRDLMEKFVNKLSEVLSEIRLAR